MSDVALAAYAIFETICITVMIVCLVKMWLIERGR